MEVRIELGHSKFDMDDAFDLRVKAIEIGKASEELWSGLTDQHKKVLTQIFKRTLEVMHVNTERFIPYILTGEPGDMIHINTQVVMSKIEEKVQIMNAVNEFERQAAKRQMIENLVGEFEPLEDEGFISSVRESLAHGVQIPNEAVQRLLQMYEEVQT